MKKIKKIVHFFFELMHLKRIPRSGLTLVGIRDIDSVAEHVCAASQIAYILGKMEKVNAERAALITLFHDNGEIRIGDANSLQKCYLNTNKGEKQAFFEQIEGLPGKSELEKMYKEFEEKNTPESIVAGDADKIELALQAKCYLDREKNKAVQLWIDRIRCSLKTNSAKKLLKVIEKTNMNEWWLAVEEIQKEVKRISPKEEDIKTRHH